MYIAQKQLEKLRNLAVPGKVVVIYGARRTGKTTLLKEFLKDETKDHLLVNGEDITVHSYLSSQSVEKLTSFVGNAKLLIVDEAQKIPDIGINLKLIVDHLSGIRMVVTGSSSFDLARHTGEPLTGRKYTLKLFPLAQKAAADAGVAEVIGVGVGGGSDGNFTAAIGVPTLDGMGATGGGAHADHEFVLVDTMVDRARLVTALIQRL